MTHLFSQFLTDDSGTVSVDWAVLSGAVIAMSLATVAVLNGGIASLVSRMDAELRDQQLGDSFVTFTSAHFEALYERNLTTPALAQDVFTSANALMNQEILDGLQSGILALEEGRLTQDDILTLTALASVARQRNIIDDQILDYYFGADGTAGRIAALL